MRKFIPYRVIGHYRQLKVEELVTMGIKLLICDVDNTLVEPDVAMINEEARNYLQSIIDQGIKVALLSNNTLQRVTVFADDLDVGIYQMAAKPLQHKYKEIKRDYPDINNDEMLALGDQLMTDVLGGNRAKVRVVLTKRFVERDMFFTKINRFLEKQIIKYIKSKGKWPIEEM